MPAEIAASAGLLVLYLLVGAATFAAAGFAMLGRVDRGLTGALLGFLLGPVGLVIAFVMRDNALRDAEEHDRRRRPPEPAPGARRGLRAASAPAARRPGTLDELERLAALRTAGHINDDEYQTLKAGAIGSAQAPARRFR